jgi:hypothetical protein
MLETYSLKQILMFCESFRKNSDENKNVRFLETSGALLLVAWESFEPPCHPGYIKATLQTGGCSYQLFEKSLKHLFYKNLNKMYYNRFCEE